MIGFIIQARTESTRYPNKIVLPFFEEESIITLLIEKLKTNFNLPIILATSTKPSNDVLENIALKNNIKCFRGSEDNVLQRFIDAAELNNITHIIRLQKH
jgi:spore coat polysaccharide biosynthesis protein SpsF